MGEIKTGRNSMRPSSEQRSDENRVGKRLARAHTEKSGKPRLREVDRL